jgi:hypothetical protein
MPEQPGSSAKLHKAQLYREVPDYLAGIFEPEADQLRLGSRIVNRDGVF